MKKAMLIAITMCGLIFVSRAMETDILKPEIHKQEQDFKKLLDKLVRDGLIYQIKVEKKEGEVGIYKPIKVIHFSHFVTIPPEIKQEIDQYEYLPFLGISRKFNKNPTYSFYMAILFMAHQKYGVFSRKPLDAIINHNKQEWEENLDENIPLLYRAFANTTAVYYYNLFRQFTPVQYQKDVQSYTSELTKNVEKYFEDITWETNKYYFNFIKWCRDSTPVKNPYLSAVMMSLFTIDGYSFDDETGVYILNDRGKLLMDFIVEFPIPENATRLQAVMNGGNKDEIEAMMQTHGTEEKWQELLKNPIHPEFSKYPTEKP